jgi:Tfp pilus assembly protein PilF
MTNRILSIISSDSAREPSFFNVDSNLSVNHLRVSPVSRNESQVGSRIGSAVEVGNSALPFVGWGQHIGGEGGALAWRVASLSNETHQLVDVSPKLELLNDSADPVISELASAIFVENVHHAEEPSSLPSPLFPDHSETGAEKMVLLPALPKENAVIFSGAVDDFESFGGPDRHATIPSRPKVPPKIDIEPADKKDYLQVVESFQEGSRSISSEAETDSSVEEEVNESDSGQDESAEVQEDIHFPNTLKSSTDPSLNLRNLDERNSSQGKPTNAPPVSNTIENVPGNGPDAVSKKQNIMNDTRSGGKTTTKRNGVVDKVVSKPAKKDKKRKDTPTNSRKMKSEVDEEEVETSSATSMLPKMLGWLSQIEQDFGSSIFMITYFVIYLYLHGFSYRLVFIGFVVIMQLLYQSAGLSLVWNTCCRFLSIAARSSASAAVHHGPAMGRERRIARGRLERKSRRLQGTFWLMSFSCVMLTSNFLYERYSVPVPLQIPLPGFRLDVRGTVNLSASMKGSSTKVSEADRLCEEAQMAEALRAWPEVESKLLLAIRLEPNHVCSLYNYGRLLDYVWHNSEQADEMYQRALAANPKHVPTLRNYGYFQFYVRKNFSKAEKMWQAAIKEQPSEIDVLSGYGMLKYQIHGDWKEGKRMFQQATLISPTHVPSLLQLASLLRFTLKDEVEAEKMYRAVLQLVPNHIAAILDYAAMMYDSAERDRGDVRRKIKKSAELWGQVLNLNPNHVDALFFLGRYGYLSVFRIC